MCDFALWILDAWAERVGNRSGGAPMWLLDRARLLGGRRDVVVCWLGLVGSLIERDVVFGCEDVGASWERVVTILADSTGNRSTKEK